MGGFRIFLSSLSLIFHAVFTKWAAGRRSFDNHLGSQRKWQSCLIPQSYSVCGLVSEACLFRSIRFQRLNICKHRKLNEIIIRLVFLQNTTYIHATVQHFFLNIYYFVLEGKKSHRNSLFQNLLCAKDFTCIFQGFIDSSGVFQIAN